MADIRDWIAESMERARAITLTLVRDLSPEELRWRPLPGANNAGFLLVHIFRAEDFHFHRMLGDGEEVWVADGWMRRWELPGTIPEGRIARASGNSWTPEQVEAWMPPPLGELLAYGAAVRESALEVLGRLDIDRLAERPNPERPERTVATYLYLATHHEAQHQAQIDYLLGLMGSGAAGVSTPP
jgi:uncharacterized damage-inducible protein DinB